MFALKIINSLSYFVSVLKKNPFFKNFLLPALVLLGINGLVVFLIWFMQPDTNYYAIDYDKKYVDYGNYGKPYSYKTQGYENSENYHKDYRENEMRNENEYSRNSNVMPVGKLYL